MSEPKRTSYAKGPQPLPSGGLRHDAGLQPGSGHVKEYTADNRFLTEVDYAEDEFTRFVREIREKHNAQV